MAPYLGTLLDMAQAVSTCLDSIVHEAPTCLLVGSRCSYHPWMLPVRSSIGQYFICSMCSACLPDWCLLVVRARGLAFLQDFVALSRMLDFLNRYELGRLLQASRVVVQYSAYDLEEFTESEIRHQEVVKFVLEQRRARVAPTTPAESNQEAETGAASILGWS